METILLASLSERGVEPLSNLLAEAGDFQIECVRSAGEARPRIDSGDCALLVVNPPLQDERGDELALYAARNSAAGVVLLLRRAPGDEIGKRMERAGVMVVEKPVVRTLFKQAVRYALASRSRLHSLQSENERLQTKLNEVRLVERAKNALIRYLGMSEPQAHRYIEKQAMDLRMSRAEVAKNVLKNYSL